MQLLAVEPARLEPICSTRAQDEQPGQPLATTSHVGVKQARLQAAENSDGPSSPSRDASHHLVADHRVGAALQAQHVQHELHRQAVPPAKGLQDEGPCMQRLQQERGGAQDAGSMRKAATGV